MKKIIILLFLVLVVSATAFAYVVTQVRTNDQLIQIGNPDASGATLTPLYESTDVLVPKTVTASKDNEKYYLQWHLTVEADAYVEYTLDTELPPEFLITTNKVPGYNFNSDMTYIITLELLEEVDYSTYTFYLYVNFR